MFNISYEEKVAIAEECREALERIKANSKSKLEENKKFVDLAKNFYEPFDHIHMETKLKVDMMYYEQLFEKLDDKYEDEFTSLVARTYSVVSKIYEHVNIKPEVYGKKVSEGILNESIDTVGKLIHETIWDFISKNFYKLTLEQRREKYLEQSRQTIKELISEGQNIDEAVKFSVKKCVMENLLRNIAFPSSVWYRIKTLSEDIDHYGAIFDVDRLNNLVESFEKSIDATSKILAVII